MHRSVADRRPGAREGTFSHVVFLTDVGIGIAIGMLAGTTGTHGSARGRMTLLAAVIGLVAGFLLDGPLGAVLALGGAVLSCLVISDLIAGASRREGSGGGALAFIVALAALVVAGISLASACTMRFRPLATRSTREAVAIELQPRSAYVMRGEIRNAWQHSIMPTRALRYSVTLRTLSEARPAPA